jgi:hypothetical protein
MRSADHELVGGLIHAGSADWCPGTRAPRGLALIKVCILATGCGRRVDAI